MTGRKLLIWRFGIASVDLLSAIAVHCFARLYPPGLFESFRVTNKILAAQTGIFRDAHSFFYPLSVGLLVGTCASTRTGATLHCLLLIDIALCLELSQYSIVAEPVVALLAETLSESTWKFIGPYWMDGVFDQLNLIVTAVGGSIALTVLTYLPKENNDARNY